MVQVVIVKLWEYTTDKFEPTISAGERPLTYALDRAATGISGRLSKHVNFINIFTFIACL